MKIKYLSECQTAEELKKAYFGWAKKLHPDLNENDGSEFKILSAEYEHLWEKLKNIHHGKDFKTGEDTIYTAKKETAETPQEFMGIILELFKIENISIELCGRWLWISGETKNCKDDLKKLGCKYSAKKKMWSWHFMEDSALPYYGKKEWKIEQIRSFWGSQNITKEENKTLITA